MEMAEYDEDEDFLKVQEQYFDERLDSLGPDLGKFMNHADLTTLKNSFNLNFSNIDTNTIRMGVINPTGPG